MSDTAPIREMASSLDHLTSAVLDAHDRRLENAIERLRSEAMLIASLELMTRARFDIKLGIERTNQETFFFFFKGEETKTTVFLLELRAGFALRWIDDPLFILPWTYVISHPPWLPRDLASSVYTKIAGPGANEGNTLLLEHAGRWLAVRFSSAEIRIFSRVGDGASTGIFAGGLNTWPAEPFLSALEALCLWMQADPRPQRAVRASSFPPETRSPVLTEVLGAVYSSLKVIRDRTASASGVVLGLDDFSADLHLRLEPDGQLAEKASASSASFRVRVTSELAIGESEIAIAVSPPEMIADGQLFEAFGAAFESDEAVADFTETIGAASLAKTLARVRAAFGKRTVLALRIPSKATREQVIFYFSPTADDPDLRLVRADFDVEEGSVAYAGEMRDLFRGSRLRDDLVEGFLDIAAGLLNWSSFF